MMTRDEFCKIQKLLDLNNRQIAESLSLSLKEIECYRTRVDSRHHRKIPPTVAIAVRLLLKVQNLENNKDEKPKSSKGRKGSRSDPMICSICGKEKPLKEFCAVGHRCKKCAAIYQKQWDAKNPDKRKCLAAVYRTKKYVCDPASIKDILYMRYFQNLKTTEIAELFGVSHQGVRYHLTKFENYLEALAPAPK
jgi:hypothetical protein